MIDHQSPLLIVGAGSIGERHINVLQSLGYSNLIVYRQRNLPFRTVDAGTVQVVTDFEEAKKLKPAAAFITSPTSLHISQAAACIKEGMHVLVEKPLGNSLAELTSLEEIIKDHPVLLQTGYMLRFHPAMQQIKSWIENKQLGKVLSFHSHWGEYLPNWHPWEDYRESYAARKELGGGAALTLSHDLDLVNWWFSSLPEVAMGIANNSSALEVDTESGVDYIFKYKTGITGHVHLNFYQKVPYRSYQVVFEEAFLTFDYFDNKLVCKSPKQEQVIHYHGFDRNQMFADQATSFFNRVNASSDLELAQWSYQQIQESKKIIELSSII